jgi:hypothetical protein
MKDRKDSDSPTGYDREIQPRKHTDLHDPSTQHPGQPGPPTPGLTVPACLTAFAQRLTRLNDKQVLHGSNALALMDPRDIAMQIVGAGRAAQLTGMSGSFELIGALALAGMMSASRAEELRVDTGDEAA